MQRVKAIIDVYCEVRKKDLIDDATHKALELLFPAQIVLVIFRKSETDVRIR